MSDFDLIDDPQPGQNAPEFTVSELSGAIKRTLEGEFGRVRVKGELGRVMRAKSGHLYFDLKDDRSVINCTTWKGQVAGLGVMPEEGLEVVVEGKLSAYAPSSRYNINVDRIAVAGVGALMAMLEKRRKQLASEGLFDEGRKRPIPFLPEVIGVVTSPSGAVIRDILHRLRERCPRKVLIWPVAVQGQNCAPEVSNAIRGFNALTPGGALPRPDLLIVARGGGSLEDLWGFNEESVVRAAAESDIPLISAVGHETDTTLIDHAADLRAPTPTAAAERAVPVRLDLLAGLDTLGARMLTGLTGGVRARGQRVRDLSRALPRAEELLSTPSQRLDHATARLPTALRSATQAKRGALAEAGAALRPRLLRTQIETGAQRTAQAGTRLDTALPRVVTLQSERLTTRAARLRPEVLSRQLGRDGERLDALSARLARVSAAQVSGWRAALEGLERVRATVGYEATLKRGYAVVRAGEAIVTTRAGAAKASALEIQFQDGRLAVATGDAPPAEPVTPKPKPAAARKRKPPAPDQGSLF
ncbi:exodeoxyribonuclease VII large subunit [Dinoroseobacter sp. S124A]|uniref:exodeoxyribonuclease VII large subunit n=1 Tax=Dinoroseobacter sp. S124A TaxID=3415128 RepID=UPI003C7BB60F